MSTPICGAARQKRESDRLTALNFAMRPKVQTQISLPFGQKYKPKIFPSAFRFST
jgi:hypothetical protein